MVSYHDNPYVFLVVNTGLLFNKLNSHWQFIDIFIPWSDSNGPALLMNSISFWLLVLLFFLQIIILHVQKKIHKKIIQHTLP